MGDDRQNQASLAAGLNEPEHATDRGVLKNRFPIAACTLQLSMLPESTPLRSRL
jgi:hypothetical protein